MNNEMTKNQTMMDDTTLIRRVQKNGCDVAKNKLIERYKGYIVSIAKKLAGYELDLDDLIQEGTIGFLIAVNKFDLSKNNALSTFATFYIKSEMHSFILNNTHALKIPNSKPTKRLFYNLKKLKKGRNLTHAVALEIAEKLDVSVESVYAMETMQLSSLSTDTTYFDWDSELTLGDSLFSPHDDTESIIINEEQRTNALSSLEHAMSCLDERSSDIIHARFLSDKKVTLKALAEKYNISNERVRQIQNSAFLEMRESFESHAH